MLLASSGWRPEMLLNIQECMGHPSPENCLVPNFKINLWLKNLALNQSSGICNKEPPYLCQGTAGGEVFDQCQELCVLLSAYCSAAPASLGSSSSTSTPKTRQEGKSPVKGNYFWEEGPWMSVVRVPAVTLQISPFSEAGSVSLFPYSMHLPETQSSQFSRSSCSGRNCLQSTLKRPTRKPYPCVNVCLVHTVMILDSGP